MTVEIPSLESVLAQNPDFVPAQLPLLLGPESKVARREDLATVGVNSYVSPGMCATKKATGDMYGSRISTVFCPSATTRSGGRVKVS